MDFIELIKHLLTIATLIVAIYGIHFWKKEYVGKKRIDMAEETLALFYEASDAIKDIRSPMGWSSETENTKCRENESEEQFKARKQASVKYERYKEHQELFHRLYSMRYRFMAQVGKEEAKPFTDLRKIVNKILHSAHMLTRLWSLRRNPEDRKHWESVEKQEAIFWDSMDENDPINPEVEKIISEIENTCRKIIDGK